MILTQQPQNSSSATDQLQQSTSAPTLPSSEPSIRPLTWLWPGRIPQGKLTLLDGSPNCGTTLFTLTLAAHLSTGQPWPDGTLCPQGNVLLITPHDNYRDTLLPRLKAAGAQLDYVLSFTHIPDPTTDAPKRTRPFSFTRDLSLLERAITTKGIILLIIDPYTALPGWRRALPALIELAQRTHCAILFTRSLNRSPSNPLQPRCPASTALTAARSHLLLAPDPRDERHCLLLTPKHSLCDALSPLAYTITITDQHQPLLSWLPAPDFTALERLCTGPLRSPHRRAILQFLHECPNPRPIKDILSATCYDYEAGRKMLLRMQHAGELISLDRGLYTTVDHPCLANLPSDSPSTPPENITDVPIHSTISIEAINSASRWSNILKELPIYRPQLWAEALAELHTRVRTSTHQELTLPLSHVPCPGISKFIASDIPAVPSSPVWADVLPPQLAPLISMELVPIIP